MSDVKAYIHRMDITEAARQRREAASARLELAQIKERLAEIKSQHQPLEDLRNAEMTERDRLYAAAYYVVVGRMPSRG